MNYKYPKNHVCHGCPYTFPTQAPSCTMGGDPEICIWHSYLGTDKKIIKAKNRTQQRDSTSYEKIQNGIEMLINVGELKFGKAYADKLRRNRIEK